MVQAFSVKGSRLGGSSRSAAFGAPKPKKLINCSGQGGNPSSLAAKKSAPNKKPPKSGIFAAQA